MTDITEINVQCAPGELVNQDVTPVSIAQANNVSHEA